VKILTDLCCSAREVNSYQVPMPMGQRSMDDFLAMFCCATALVKVDHHGGMPAHYTKAPFASLDWPLRGDEAPP